MDPSKNAVVIGAGNVQTHQSRIRSDHRLGVIGLTTALRIQEKCGYTVSIVAEIFPTDPKSIKYTSHWAVRTCFAFSFHEDYTDLCFVIFRARIM